MRKSTIIKFCAAFVIILILASSGNTAFAQIQEPDVVKLPQPKTPLSEGYHNGWSVDVMLNNFGFGLGGSYKRVLGPYTELTFSTGITGIRDDTEQNFQSFITGQQVIPNKYKRAFGFPFLLGIKHRIFAQQVADNFRLFLSGSAGPALAFTYPYLDDTDGNGFRTFQIQQGYLVPLERVNDFFTGWKNGHSHWGVSGELKIGADIGSFKHPTTVEFGYFFYYFKPGLQIMEPYQPFGYDQQTGLPIAVNSNGQRDPFYDAQRYFGTPQIKITFGGMW
ncbi:MAG TPA: hypothetical protein VJ964_06180 [Balneolaceae bacterium]|nr:hypothetical protein [Balneolaceae bacterium]